MAISPEIFPQPRLAEGETPRTATEKTKKNEDLFNLQEERTILEPKVDGFKKIARSLGITPEWIDTLPSRFTTRIKINKQYTMEKVLEDMVSHPEAAHQFHRPSEEIRYALGGIRNNVANLYTELFTMGAISGTELMYTKRKNWNNIQSTQKHPEDKKIKLAMQIAEKDAKLDIINYLLSDTKENIIYKIAEADKKRVLCVHP